MEPVQRGSPSVAIDQIVPVGYQIAEGTALMAERNPAVHAAGALGAKLVVGERLVYLEVVVQALGGRPPEGQLPGKVEKTGRFTHASPPRARTERGLGGREPSRSVRGSALAATGSAGRDRCGRRRGLAPPTPGGNRRA